MLTVAVAFSFLLKFLESSLQELGFARARLDGEAQDRAWFVGERGTLRILLSEDRAVLSFTKAAPDAVSEQELQQVSVSALEISSVEERDCRMVASEFSDAMKLFFHTAKFGNGVKSVPKSVSKASIENGDASYDALTFCNELTGRFTELRAAYKENYERYGEFLPEEFFLNQGGNSLVLSIIRENDSVKMRRLLRLLNDVYENGTNEVQSLVSVTILGNLQAGQPDGEVLLARIVDYLSPDLGNIVISVNSFLKKNAKSQEKLKDPPVYKPKKPKKPGFFKQLMGGGSAPGA